MERQNTIPVHRLTEKDAMIMLHYCTSIYSDVAFQYPQIIPGSVWSISDGVRNILDCSRNAPDNIQNVPDRFRSIPDDFRIIPDSFLSIPDYIMNHRSFKRIKFNIKS